MADNVQVTQGSGTVMATDDVAGVQYPRVKVSVGSDGTAQDVSSANPMPTADDAANALLTNIDTDIGTLADSAATSDTGSFSIISFIKRGMQNWTTLLARIPALVSGRIPVDGSGVTQPVSGTVTANAGTGSFTVAQATAENLNATVTGTVAATQSGTWNVNNISGVVSLPTGAATSANQTIANASLSSIDTKLTAPLSVTGPLTNAQLRAAPVPNSVPVATSVTILNLTTAAIGSNWTAFASQSCNALDIVNNTPAAIEYRRGGSGSSMQITSGAGRIVVGITNANQIEVRRVDQLDTQVIVQAEAITI